MHPDIETIRITEEEIAARVNALGAQITRDYEGKDLILIGVLTGSTLFMAGDGAAGRSNAGVPGVAGVAGVPGVFSLAASVFCFGKSYVP